ncbi:MAG: type transport system ATP-binding protein [Acidimicrobiaceae bacterium]
MAAAVVVDGASKRFRLYHELNQSLKSMIVHRKRSSYEEFWALRDVSFEIPAGTTFGLIGENGSGKSTLLKCMAKILRPDTGSVSTVGKVSALLELGAGFHPELSGRDNVYMNGSILGLSSKQIDERFDEIVDFAGLDQFIDTPVKNYSSGMYVRLGFSVAINVDPDILLVDEVLAVGDEVFQRKCAEKFADLKDRGKTIVLVSHALGMVGDLCEQVALLEHGKLITVGDSRDVIEGYLDQVYDEQSVASSDHPLRSKKGSSDGRIQSIEVLSGSGQPLSRLRTGDAVVFRIHYRADEEVLRPVFGIAIDAHDGTLVTGPTTRDSMLQPESVVGEGYVDYRLDPLILLPGSYEIGASLFDLTRSRGFDRRTRILRFDVDPGRPHEHDGIVTLGGTWDGAVFGDR